MLKHLKVILLLSITMMGDTILGVSLVWNVAKFGGSKVLLGVFLSASALLPFLIQRRFHSVTHLIAKHPLGFFAVIRFLGLLLSAGGLIFIKTHSLAVVYTQAGFFTVANFLNLQVIDILMSARIRKHLLTSHDAAKIVQATVQVSSFAGAALAGFLIDFGGLQAICIATCLTFCAGFFVPPLLAVKTSAADQNEKSDPIQSVKTSGRHKQVLNECLLILTLAGLVIGSFNLLFPLSIQEKGLRALVFGLADALGGIGGLVAVIVSSREGSFSQLWKYSPFALGGFAVLISHSFSPLLIGASTFGFCTSLGILRIKQRAVLFENTKESAINAAVWSYKINTGQLFARAVSPLLIGGLLGLSASLITASHLFTVTMIAIAAVIAGIQWKQMRDAI